MLLDDFLIRLPRESRTERENELYLSNSGLSRIIPSQFVRPFINQIYLDDRSTKSINNGKEITSILDLLIEKIEPNRTRINQIKLAHTNLEEITLSPYFREEFQERFRSRLIQNQETNPRENRIRLLLGGNIAEPFYQIESSRMDKMIDRKDAQYFREQAARMREGDPERLAKALEEFERATRDPDFGTTFLRRFLKQNQAIPEEELSKYELVLDLQRDGSHYGRHFIDKYFDTPFNFCLTYEGQLIASAGFDPEERRMSIAQIQGIAGKGDKLKSFKWERALVDYAVQYAEQYGIPEVAVVSVNNNKWAQDSFNALKSRGIYPRGTTFEDAKKVDPSTERAYKEAAERKDEESARLNYSYRIHLMPHQGFMLYDVTAQRSGFKKDAAGNYVRQTLASQEERELNWLEQAIEIAA